MSELVPSRIVEESLKIVLDPDAEADEFQQFFHELVTTCV